MILDEYGAQAELGRIENAVKTEPVCVLPDEKNVPVPIEQYANMILAMQKLEDIKSIVRQTGYIGSRSSSMFNDNEDALLSIAAILKGEDA